MGTAATLTTRSRSGKEPQLGIDDVRINWLAALRGMELINARFLSRRSSPHSHAELEIGVALVREHIDTHYADRIRLASLAHIARLSVFHLIRIFRAATGLSPYAYLGQVRVHRAAFLLREGMAVSMVAAATGFADQSHLTRLFKRLVGVPPGEYQRASLVVSARHTAARLRARS